MSKTRSTVAVVLALVVVMLAVSACGSSSSSSSSTSGGSSASAAAPTSTTSSSGGSSAGAEAGIAPYLGHPGAFPVVDALNKVPKGAKIVYVDCGTPICALFWQLLQPAGKAMGVSLSSVKAGSAANTVSQAFDSVVAEKPAAVIVTAINVQLWSRQLKQLQAAHIPVVTTGITGTAPYNVVSPQAAEPQSDLEGKLLADYVATKFGAKSNVVLYDVPELPFTTVVGQAFQAELSKVCPTCAARVAHIPVATIGTTAPSTVVSDLQAHPSTTVAVFGTDEAETGLPNALHSAGISVKTMGVAPSPTNLQYVKDGKETATLGYDLPVATWALLDQAAREIGGQKLSGDEAKGITDMQFLTQPDIKFDPSKGWTGYPDFAQRYLKLWNHK